MGGAKLETKLQIIEKVLPIMDKVFICGVLCYTFIQAQNQLGGEFVDIKDPLLRLREFIGESWISCSVLFQNSSDRIDIDINEKDYDKLDQWFGSDESHSTGILDIYIFFNI
jgi:3-phosphoglycerate kinase